MKGYRLLALIAALAAALLATNCKREEKATGPEPVLPEGGTTLMFANCAPFAQQIGIQPFPTLVADARFACSGTVLFSAGLSATWTSDGFHIAAGDYKEGFHIVFERTLQQAETPAVFLIAFRGLANQFTITDTIPAGTEGDALHQVLEIAQTGTAAAADTLRSISLSVSDISGIATLDLQHDAGGSFLKIGADISNLCQFKMYYDSQNGVAYDTTHAFDITYGNTNGDPTDSVVLDFTHGAHMLSSHRVQLGDKYGVAYVGSETGGCRDTLSFWAFPSATSFREDVIAHALPTSNLISDGRTAWFWDVQQVSPDSVPCAYFRISADSILGTPLVHQPLYTCDANTYYKAFYDQTGGLVWVVQHMTASHGVPDTAWGYDTQGALDSIVTSPSFPAFQSDPTIHLYRGYWVRSAGNNLLSRNIVETPFLGGSDLPPRTLPAEITEDFAGGAGIGYPGAAKSTSWTVNAFDANGFWIGRFPVTSQDPTNVAIYSASLISADHLIIYSVLASNTQTGAIFQEVRVLNPDR